VSENIQTELTRRHKTAANTVIVLIVATALLSLVAFLGKGYFRHSQNPSLDIAVRITILIFGLGAVVLRRTRFAAMRLQDITALNGPTGLLQTLEKTTLQIALLGSVIAVIGFVATLLTGNDFYTYGACLVGLAVLLYVYPTRKSWDRTMRQFGTENDQNSENNSIPKVP
jgi:peptidoglycan/LPS O-acetylase OafA/YrhL